MVIAIHRRQWQPKSALGSASYLKRVKFLHNRKLPKVIAGKGL